MARGPLTFRQRDLCAAIKATKAAGYEVARVEVDRDGRIIVIPERPRDDAATAHANEWDSVIANAAAVHSGV
jgi:hypothetical protein